MDLDILVTEASLIIPINLIAVVELDAAVTPVRRVELGTSARCFSPHGGAVLAGCGDGAIRGMRPSSAPQAVREGGRKRDGGRDRERSWERRGHLDCSHLIGAPCWPGWVGGGGGHLALKCRDGTMRFVSFCIPGCCEGGIGEGALGKKWES